MPTILPHPHRGIVQKMGPKCPIVCYGTGYGTVPSQNELHHMLQVT